MAKKVSDPTAMTRSAPKGSMADRINEMSGAKTPEGGNMVLQTFKTCNLRDPHKKQGGNHAFSTGGVKRS